MPLLTTIKDNATSISATGGSSASIAWMGRVGSAITGYFTGDASLKLRRLVTCRVKEPKANTNSPGGFTQARRTVSMLLPVTITEGGVSRVATNKITLEYASDSATASADNKNARYLMGQFLSDPVNDAFFDQLAL